jgi:hypothetical protein
MKGKEMTDTTYVLCVRSWWDKQNGSSYYSMRIVGSDGTNEIVPFTYGHGYRTYQIKACEVLGIDFDALPYPEQNKRLFVDCTEVTRRKDLHKPIN